MRNAVLKNSMIVASLLAFAGMAEASLPQDLSSGNETLETKATALQAPEKKPELSPEMKALKERHKAELDAMKKDHEALKARWESLSDAEKAEWKAKMKAEKDALVARHKAEVKALKNA